MCLQHAESLPGDVGVTESRVSFQGQRGRGGRTPGCVQCQHKTGVWQGRASSLPGTITKIAMKG